MGKAALAQVKQSGIPKVALTHKYLYTRMCLARAQNNFLKKHEAIFLLKTLGEN